ncbi:hypothetical protein AD947_10065 [Acetobacter tropicalis]|uniref:Uncharacterized protein n=1 Tax=Acetobacter tropicalis TaxID=104102 RepID=A0A149TU72_9PROT|nr:hypothetical protein [Acetobacter tropicalis]KXV56692.1 hypothetical protein AD947_10065 [Acetobacter tropicalis]
MATLTAWNKKDIKTIIESKKFDYEYYNSENPDVETSGLDPIVHYVLFGYKENKNPNENFNTKIYYNLYKNTLGNGENPFAHYLRNNENLHFFEKGLLQEYSYHSITLALNRLKNYPFFNADDYLNMNGDVASTTLSPLRHALLYGIGEGRDIFSKRSIAHALGVECRKPVQYEISTKSLRKPAPKTIGVFHHSEGNSFIKEISECLNDYLNESGLNSRLLTEKTNVQDAPDLCIFCAPHEFFFLSGSEPWKKDEIIRNAIMFNTEQPQTLWFTRGIIYIFMSAGVMDLCYQNLKSFSDVGLPVFHFDPPVEMQDCLLTSSDRKHPLFRVLPEGAQKNSSPFRPFHERSIDVSFFGNASRKREKFFSRSASFFSDYQTFFYYRKAEGPLPASGVYDILSRLPRYVSENSKISLNIHRDDNSFFEWHRIVKQGMASGSIVVTEECFPHPLYKEGTHFLAETPRHMPNLIEWLIRSEEGQKKAAEIQENIINTLEDDDLFQSKSRDVKNYIATVWSTLK